jgi:hypothetical protein
MALLRSSSRIVALIFLAACTKQASAPNEAPATGPTSAPVVTAVVTAAPPTSQAIPPTIAPAATATPAVATTKPFVPSFPVPPFKGKFPHLVDPTVNEAGRVVDVVYAGPGTDTEPPLYKLTNRSGKAVIAGQAWLFTYDATGKYIERISHSFGRGLALEPGQTKEERLGRVLKDMKPGAVTFEGELTRAMVGSEPWFNENLAEERPKGGLSPDALIAVAGERVIVEIYDLTSLKARLTNVSDRAVSRTGVKVLYYDAKGELAKALPTSEDVVIAPGKSVDVTLHPAYASDKKPPPATAVRAVAFAPTVTFVDGKSFDNENLASESRRLP